MRAFISHSSKDKAFVRQVVTELGSMAVEFDEQTFDLTLNVQAIRQALRRSSVVAFFVSASSVTSSFVTEEQRQTLEAIGRGEIKKVLIFCIDDTSFRALPDWMREINVLVRASNPKACARRIQKSIIEQGASSALDEIYLGRDEEEGLIRKALAVPKKSSPLFVHVSGFHGIGRRTFIRKSMSRILPRYYETFLEITAQQYQGIEDLYRTLYSLHFVSSVKDMVEDFERFSNLQSKDQAGEIARLISELSGEGSPILVVDEFGVFDEEGDYQTYWSDVLEALDGLDRPAVAFAQSRMQPHVIRSQYPRAYHLRLTELSDTNSRDLIALSLRAEGVDFDSEDVGQLAELVDGHPFNLRFVVGYAKHYGLQNFLRDPRDFIEWKHRRGEDFLKKLEFSDGELDIIAALAEYRHMSADLLVDVTGLSTEQLMTDLRTLQDYCCVEYRNGFFHLASPIREATRRDPRFAHDDAWHRQIAEKICEAAARYNEDDHVPLSLIEGATLAKIRGGSAPAYLKSLVLPSHLLMVAREHYDRHLRPQCIDLCKRAFEMRARMNLDAQVETLRLWGLSAARSNDALEFDRAIQELNNYTYPTANRVKLFLQGFNARLKGNLETAEHRFKRAWDLAPRNAHINRELASLYCRQRRYTEAEKYARSTYDIQKTNPYIIDILLETLLGKRHSGQKVDDREIARLREELRTHSQEQDTIFYNLREAQSYIASRDYNAAAAELSEAFLVNDAVPAAYFLGIDLELRRGNLKGAEDYYEKVKAMLKKQGQSEGDECKLMEAQVDILSEKGQYLAARRLIEDAKGVPQTFLTRVSRNVARYISFSGSASTELTEWANRQLSSNP